MLSTQDYNKLVADLRQAVGEMDSSKFQSLSPGLGLGDLQRVTAKKAAAQTKDRSVDVLPGWEPKEQKAETPRPVTAPSPASVPAPKQTSEPAIQTKPAPVPPQLRNYSQPQPTETQYEYEYQASTPQRRMEQQEFPSPRSLGRGLKFLVSAARILALHFIDLAVVAGSISAAIAIVFMVGRVHPGLSIIGLEKLAAIALSLHPGVLLTGLYLVFGFYFGLFYLTVGSTFGQMILGKVKVSQEVVPTTNGSMTRFSS